MTAAQATITRTDAGRVTVRGRGFRNMRYLALRIFAKMRSYRLRTTSQR